MHDHRSVIKNDPGRGHEETIPRIRDITAHKGAEEALRQSEERMRVQFKSIPVPPDLVLMHINAVTLQKLAEEHLQYISIHDSLSGLFNRFYSDVEIDRIMTSRKYPVSIIMVDLDGLKTVNDREGHAAGDHLLRDTGTILKQSFHPEDMIARIGGDEFLVLLPAVDATVCDQSVARLKTNLEIFNARGPGRTVHFSVGAATAYAGAELKECIQRADARMYREKAEKKLNSRPLGAPLDLKGGQTNMHRGEHVRLAPLKTGGMSSFLSSGLTSTVFDITLPAA